MLPRGREVAALLVLVLAALLLWVVGVGRLDVHRSMEASRALVSQQMLASGDYVVPHRGADVYLAKPPLYNWAVVLASTATGGRVTPASVRWPSALSVLATVLVVYAATRTVLGARTALLSAAVLVLTPFALEHARDGNVGIDTMLGLGVSLALFGAFFTMEPARRRIVGPIVCGVGLAIGSMTKGPIVFAFFLPTALLYLGFRRAGMSSRPSRAIVVRFALAAAALWLVAFLAPRLGSIAALGYVVPAAVLLHFAFAGPRAGEGGRVGGWALAIGVAALLAAPWVALLLHRLGAQALIDDLRHELWQERMTAVGTSNQGPIWTYLARFPFECLPFVLLVPIPFVPGYAAGASEPRRRLLLFLRCWLAGSLVFFTVVAESRRIRYLFPALPAAAVLSGDAFATCLAGSLSPRARAWAGHVARGTVVAVCAAPAGIAWFATRSGAKWGPWLVASVAVALAGGVAGVALRRRGRPVAAMLVATFLALAGVKVFLDVVEPERINREDSPRLAVERLRARVPSGETLFLAGLPPERATGPVVAATYYLDAMPLDRDRPASARYVVFEATDPPSFSPPAGTRAVEVAREKIPGTELVLMRLEPDPRR